jgi:L-amino acid N-acyltransferase YncA
VGETSVDAKEAEIMFIIPIDEELSLKLLQKEDAAALFDLVDQSRDYLSEWLPWVENKCSRAIPERLDFREEGTLRQMEKLAKGYVDHVVYSMVKSEWVGA